MWLQDCILVIAHIFIEYTTGLGWIYLCSQMFSLKINHSRATCSLARCRLNRRRSQRKRERKAQIFMFLQWKWKPYREREMDPDWGRWFILDSEHPLSTGQSFPRWVSHCGCLWIHHCYIIGQIVIITGRQCCLFRAKAFWVSGEGRWWQERKADWKNNFQHIYPLAVVQDTPSGPWSQPLRLNMCFYSPPSFLYNPSFHSVISSPSPSSSSSALVFCCILHWHRQKQQSLEGKYAKLLYDLPFCSGRGHCTKTCQLFCFLSNKY